MFLRSALFIGGVAVLVLLAWPEALGLTTGGTCLAMAGVMAGGLVGERSANKLEGGSRPERKIVPHPHRIKNFRRAASGTSIPNLPVANNKDGYIVLWSGGKDSYLALLKAKQMGLNISCILTLKLVDDNGMLKNAHETAMPLIQMQSKALRILIITKPSALNLKWEGRQNSLREAVEELRAEDYKIKGVVAGFLSADYVEPFRQICRNLDLEPVTPLSGRTHWSILLEITTLGIKTVVLSALAGFNYNQVVGREPDQHFIKFLIKKGMDDTTTVSSYHTLVTDGPLNKRRILVEAPKTFKHGDWWILTPESCRLVPKEPISTEAASGLREVSSTCAILIPGLLALRSLGEGGPVLGMGGGLFDSWGFLTKLTMEQYLALAIAVVVIIMLHTCAPVFLM
jgi:uncharacterized protein (TIGR00290 family)